MESDQAFKKKLITLCQAFKAGWKAIKKWFDKILSRIVKIGKKEKRKSKQGGLKPSPKDILFS
jgi:hypothetical protein